MKKDYSDKQIVSRPSAAAEELKLKKRRKHVVRIVVTLCVLIFFSANYVFWFLPFFRINTIIVDGSFDQTLAESLQPVLEKHYKGQQIILNRLKESKDDVSSIVPNLISTSLSRRLPSTLVVHIQQRQPAYRITQPDGAVFLADHDGYVFSNMIELKGGLPVEIPTSSLILIGENFLPQTAVANLSANISQLNNFFAINIAKISQINNLPIHFNLYSQKRWYIMVNLQNDANASIQTLKTFLSEKYQIESGLTYIDLRIPNSVYYK